MKQLADKVQGSHFLPPANRRCYRNWCEKSGEGLDEVSDYHSVGHKLADTQVCVTEMFSNL